MTYFVTFHWGFLLGAGMIGLAMGWISVVHRGPSVSLALGRWLSLLVAVLLAVSLARLVPGRFGYWLDLGLVMFAIYLVGCAVGSWLRDRVVSRHQLSSS